MKISRREGKRLDFAAALAQLVAEARSGKFYVRNRWYDPTTGTWLSPDPLGYRDSSNLYAFAGGDPINGRDPEGLGDGIVSGVGTALKETVQGVQQCTTLFKYWFGYHNLGKTEWESQAFDYEWNCMRPAENAVNAGAIQTIGGGTEKYRAGIAKAWRSGDRAEAARLATHGVIDFLALGMGIEGATSLTPTGPTPELATVTGSAVPVAAPTVGAVPVVPTIMMASTPDNDQSPSVHKGKQGKHIRGDNNFVEGNSELTEDAQTLVNDFAEKGQQAGSTPRGRPGFKERVDFGRVIGYYFDKQTGKYVPTTKGIIHHAADGVHVVPAKP